jgi:hypothetical protein
MQPGFAPSETRARHDGENMTQTTRYATTITPNIPMITTPTKANHGKTMLHTQQQKRQRIWRQSGVKAVTLQRLQAPLEVRGRA